MCCLNFFAGLCPAFFCCLFFGVMYSFVRRLCAGVLYENDFCEPLVVAENQKYD